ncbi:MAG: enolase C-terminal domain-like protein, partial [Pseudomonadota bacterium]
WGSDINTAAALHLAAATPQRFVLNVCDLSGYVSPRLDKDGPTRLDGFISLGSAPGHGITPDMDVLGQPILELE